MKLLLDENLSDRIVAAIESVYPGSAHVKTHGLTRSDDGEVWDFAAKNGFTILSKDSDFHQRSLVHGQPPKFVFLRVGNCSTRTIIDLLLAQHDILDAFDADAMASILVLK